MLLCLENHKSFMGKYHLLQRLFSWPRTVKPILCNQLQWHEKGISADTHTIPPIIIQEQSTLQNLIIMSNQNAQLCLGENVFSKVTLSFTTVPKPLRNLNTKIFIVSQFLSYCLESLHYYLISHIST